LTIAVGLVKLLPDVDVVVIVGKFASLTCGDGDMSPLAVVIGGGGTGARESVRLTIASALFCARCALRVVSVTTRILDSCVHVTTCSRSLHAIAWYFL
jgi:hypothetical protein